MADEEVEAEGAGETNTGNTDDKNSKANQEKKKKNGEQWEKKQKKREKELKEQIFPWGSDPCVKVRSAGGTTERDITKPAGYQFPWYEKPVKKADYLKKQEKNRLKLAKRELKENKEKFTESKKRFLKQLEEMSKWNRRKRIYETSGFYYRTRIPFEVMEQRKREAKERRKREDAKWDDSSWEEEEEEEEEEGDDGQEKGEEEKKGKKRKKKTKARRKIKRKKEKATGAWPGSYPQPLLEDFIFFLKMMVLVEYEAKESSKLPLPSKKTPDKRRQVVDEFVSFLDVLLTANQMMRNKDEKVKVSNEDVDDEQTKKPSRMNSDDENTEQDLEENNTENVEEEVENT